MFNITETESRNMVHDFYESEEFAKLKPIPGVCKQMGYLRKHADTMYIVTGRQSYARDQTEKWLEYWFPKTFDDLIMTNSYTDHEIEKHEICRSLALDSIIDDSFDVCTKCNRIGIDSYNIDGKLRIISSGTVNYGTRGPLNRVCKELGVPKPFGLLAVPPDASTLDALPCLISK
jgi:hypothetical protein